MAIAIAGLTACGTSEEQSLCSVYTDYQAARAKVQAVDPESQSAADALGIVEDYRDTVSQLAATSTDRYRSAIADLDAALSDSLLTLQSVEGDADYATWAPLVEDEFQAAAEAADKVEELINPQCNPNVD